MSTNGIYFRILVNTAIHCRREYILKNISSMCSSYLHLKSVHCTIHMFVRNVYILKLVIYNNRVSQKTCDIFNNLFHTAYKDTIYLYNTYNNINVNPVHGKT